MPALSGRAGTGVQCEWGAAGLIAGLPLSDVVVIVNVRSFATCVEVAVTRRAIDRGWAEDVRLAAERDVSATVPARRDGAYHRLEST